MAAPGTEPDKTEEQLQAISIARNAVNYIEKFERYDCQENLAFMQTHWMLSTEDFRYPTDPPMGLISNINPQNSNTCVILIPEEDHTPPLDYRELHQIVRELTMGLYVLNQTPTLSLEANFDQSTTCQLPPAYQDTRIGQIMISVDYMMKCLWHGCYFPKDKRTKFSEKWRSSLDVNANGKPETKKTLITEFLNCGLQDITKDPDYATAYDKLPVESSGDTEMAEERRFFMSHADDLTVQMTLFQKHVTHYKDMFVMDSDWVVSSVVKVLDDRLDALSYERLNSRLQLHEQLIMENLDKKAEIRRQLYLLKVIGYMTPFLIGMKKRMKIPDINRLLPNLTGDECRTERELPPLMLSSDFKCKNFYFGNHYFHLHGGIMIDLDTDQLTEDDKYSGSYEKTMKEASTYLAKLLTLENTMLEHYKVPTTVIDGKSYYVMCLDFETFYPTNPQKPLWVKVYHEELNKLKPKKLPVSDIHLHEQFKKYFGYKKAIKCKTPYNGLKECAKRGLVAMFFALTRKMMQASRLGKQDEHGLSLLHYAAMNNHPQIIAILLIQSMDVNVRRNNIMGTEGGDNKGTNAPGGMTYYLLEICPTAIHVAARCGALDTVACLLANYANILATDQDGWAPIHHAAFFDHYPVVRLMIRKNKGLMELVTKNDLRSTPILLAASSGGLSVLKGLISSGADYRRLDGEGNGIVSLAALRFHTNVLEYLIEWNNPDVHVWQILVGMLKSNDQKKKDSSVKCLEVLSTSKPDHWKSILEAEGVPALVDLLKIDNEELQCVAASVLCNISEQTEVRQALTKCKAGPILIKLLSSPVDDVQSRASIILSDLACVEGNQELIAQENGITPLVALLESELEDVLVNAVNAIRVLCENNRTNKTLVAEAQGLEPLVEFLTVDSAILQAATAATIAAVASGHEENQNILLDEGAAKPLVDLIKGRNVRVQVKAANALESMATNNARCQKAFLDLDAPKVLLKLLKNISEEVREQGACALWSLSGGTKGTNTQQKYIAEITGITLIHQMLLESTEKLLTVGCLMCIALGRESIENQNRLAKADCFSQLVRLLRKQKTLFLEDSQIERVMLWVIKVLGILCIGVAYRNNKTTQNRIAEEGAIPLLVKQLNEPISDEVQVQVAMSLGCLILSNPKNQDLLNEVPNFKFEVLLDMLKSKNTEIRLNAGMALTIFAFNNTPQQYAIREAGGVKYSVFKEFIKSPDEFHNCYAAFQIVVLARVIIDKDQVKLTAKGVKLLVQKISSENDNTVVLASSLLSSLAHTRAGIPDAMVTTGAIDVLIVKLSSPNEQVRAAVAVALGYLTFNKTAARLLLGACRNTPGLYKKLIDNIGEDAKISPDFKSDFNRALHVGLPSQCLEINGGPPIIPASRMGLNGKRPMTTQPRSRKAENIENENRAVSAPARTMKAPSIFSRSNEDSRPSTSMTRPSTGHTRPPSGSTTKSTRINLPSPDHSQFKSKLRAWKEEK
ncbi:ankyrin and armadillo repeat-containing protein-like isoform X2 [Dreissena polymorpha]|uniref:ankyrin and armadillo repeat-containing protein-like isoform X2 n=1 Tax=Dreissena polymorpha TaxID=45954 RepID=UPI002264960C|nr:ankyrin and armadillo repeat-containing protein-like isoform X2 [Dreissena polymorpha]